MNYNEHGVQHDMPARHKPEHGCHTGGTPGMSHGSASDFLKRFWIVTFLLIPLIALNPKVLGVLGVSEPVYGNLTSLFITTMIFGFAIVFFKHAKMEIDMRMPGMMTLVSIAVGAGYAFSIVSTFMPSLETVFYIEISTLIWVLLFGHYLEAKSSSAAGDALDEVGKLLPQEALVRLDDGTEYIVGVAELKEGDMVIVKPGEKVPADGDVLEGSALVDESLISGESKPVARTTGNRVIAGSIVVDSALVVLLTHVGENSTVGQIKALIAAARQTKPKSQQLADRAAFYLTFFAGITALLALVVWTAILGQPIVFGITIAITVLVIACPHALGLAIPTVTTIATTIATKHGIFIKDLSKIETIRKVTTIVFDKTGTLTKGVFEVEKVAPLVDITESELVSIAASLEQYSSHIIGYAVVAYAQALGVRLTKPKRFKNKAGRGIVGSVSDTDYIIGNKKMMQENGLSTSGVPDNSTLIIADVNRVLGYMLMSDAVKEESKEVVEKLQVLGINVVMITGDSDTIAKQVAMSLGISKYFAEVLPEDKYKHVVELQKSGEIVLMVGDGVNDAPALTQADVGVAVKTGTDIAIETGDVVLLDSSPMGVVRLLKLSKAVYRKMVENLVWALGYNSISIPAAAGVFASFGIFLRPEVGALVMSLSTVIVVFNAMRLKNLRL